MIDEEAFERLSPMAKSQAKQALVGLHLTGVLQNQRNIEYSKILVGSMDQSLEDLATRILEYRRIDIQLQTLQQLAEQFEKESLRG